MARKSAEKNDGALRRAATSVAGALSRIARRVRGNRENESVSFTTQSSESPREPMKAAEPATPARTVHRESDIGLDVLSRTYTPAATSGKAGFRSNGADHQSDQEFAIGFSDERWNDEDRLTNKSGDPRIGTHGRTYEPGEVRGKARE
ncbi:MAG TPA: hypothetical protein VF698_05305 [Thermoanaerobaculia bacterium]|jgi:hypothetical protein